MLPGPISNRSNWPRTDPSKTVQPAGIGSVEGLEVGQWVATAGASTLVEGQKVRLLASDGDGAS